MTDDGEDVEDATTADGGDDDGDVEDAVDAEPLGDLRERVVDEADTERPASFPNGDGDDDDDDRADEDPDGSGSPDDRSGPLGDLAAGVEERRRRKTETDEELFDEVQVDEVDSDALWDQVASDEPVISMPDSREVREVSKHKYCQNCPHFARPPDVHCSHDGTEILEQVDMSTFKVADCPIVLEDERLEDVTTESSGDD